MYCIYTELSLLYVCTQNNWQSMSDWVSSVAYSWKSCPEKITYTDSWRAGGGIKHNETIFLGFLPLRKEALV